MKTVIKAFLIFALLVFIQIHISEQMQVRGRQLAFLRNLPHRYLGMMYYSWMLQPHRTDLLCNYAIEWHTAVVDRGSLLEGMKKPVVPLLIAKHSGLNPKDENLHLLSKMLLNEELKAMEPELKPKPILEPKIEAIEGWIEETK